MKDHCIVARHFDGRMVVLTRIDNEKWWGGLHPKRIVGVPVYYRVVDRRVITWPVGEEGWKVFSLEEVET